MSSKIHKTAIIEDGAIIGKNVEIGPYSIIGKDVTLGDNVILKSHVIITGNTIIGDNNIFYSFSVIGEVTPDKKYKGEDSQLKIGNNNIIREYVTVNPGTEGGGMLTKIGNNCLLMMSSHVAHDCIVGDNVILVNNATLGGHVEVGDYAIIGGLSGIHQRVRIGEHAMIGGMSAIESDVIPFGIAFGERAYLEGLNLVGMKRRGFSKESIQEIRKSYELLFELKHATFEQRINEVASKFKHNAEIMRIVDFLHSELSNARAICKPKV